VVAAAQADAYLDALRYELPAERQGYPPRSPMCELLELDAARGSGFAARQPDYRPGEACVTQAPLEVDSLYIRHEEFARGAPGRCRHGRNHRGCVPGHGTQRDRWGNDLSDEQRRPVREPLLPAVWHPPLDFDEMPTNDTATEAAPDSEPAGSQGQDAARRAAQWQQVHSWVDL